MAPLHQRIEGASHALHAAAQTLEVELPDLPTADQADADESEWLFDAAGDYLDQLRHSKARGGDARE
jgi:hypothetical protein